MSKLTEIVRKTSIGAGIATLMSTCVPMFVNNTNVPELGGSTTASAHTIFSLGANVLGADIERTQNCIRKSYKGDSYCDLLATVRTPENAPTATQVAAYTPRGTGVGLGIGLIMIGLYKREDEE